MTAASLWETQQAVYDKLKTSSTVTSLLQAGAQGILDVVPEGTVFPYIAFGEISASPLETMDGAGFEQTLTLYVFSRYEGQKELKTIMAAVFSSLHDGSLSIPGQTLVLIGLQSSEIRLEADGITRRGLLRFRIITEPAA